MTNVFFFSVFPFSVYKAVVLSGTVTFMVVCFVCLTIVLIQLLNKVNDAPEADPAVVEWILSILEPDWEGEEVEYDEEDARKLKELEVKFGNYVSHQRRIMDGQIHRLIKLRAKAFKALPEDLQRLVRVVVEFFRLYLLLMFAHSLFRVLMIQTPFRLCAKSGTPNRKYGYRRGTRHSICTEIRSTKCNDHNKTLIGQQGVIGGRHTITGDIVIVV